ncbi:MAG: nitroreductase family protein [Sphingomonadaceae bacterium]
MTDIFNDRSSALSLLRTRRSGKARDLAAPGPDAAQLETILSTASRVPDHGKLAPWRFVVIEQRERFAGLLTRLATEARVDMGKLERNFFSEFAHQAPVMIVLLSTPVEGKIPLWEQQLSTGAAAQNLLLAAHALGFTANWLTTAAADVPGLADALGYPGGKIAGFFFIGTQTRPLEERPRPELAQIVSRF